MKKRNKNWKMNELKMIEKRNNEINQAQLEKQEDEKMLEEERRKYREK